MSRFSKKAGWRLGVSALAIAAIGHSAPGLAQTPAAPPPSVSGSTALKPIVITARHRAEKAQSVPVSLTVVDAKQIKTVGSDNLEKLQQLVPSLTVEAFNPRNNALNVRGLGSLPNLANDGLEGGVGVYVDGVLLARPAQSVFDLPDIADIEVLRGPQGTLFGKNTVAGAVNITTLLPTFAPHASGSISYGSENYFQLKAAASSAVAGSDKLAFGLALEDTQHNGPVTNTTNYLHYGNQDDKGIRAQILYNATPALTIRLIYDYSHQHEDCCVNQPIAVLTSYANGAPVPNAKNVNYLYPHLFGYTVPTDSAFARQNDVNSPVYYDMETGGATLLADYDLDGFTISSISGFRYWNWYPHNDSDDTKLDLLNVEYTDEQRQFSQELRLTSPLGGRVDYTGGLYFFYQGLNGQQFTGYGSQAGTALSQALPGTATNLAYSDALDNFAGDYNTVFDTRSLAAYGQAVLHVTPRFDITGGLRETYEVKTASFNERQEGGIALSAVPGPLQATVTAIRNGASPIQKYGRGIDNALLGGLLTFSYKVTPDILTYATYSHGEKSAGVNLFAINALNKTYPTDIKPETIDNYEAGIKTTLLDNRLILDGDAFWDEDTNYQATTIALTGTSLFTYVVNVPKVRSRGVELDARAQPTDNLSLFASGVYDDAYFESFSKGVSPFETFNLGPNTSETGKAVPGNSTWVGSFGGEYDQPLPPVNGHDLIAYFGGNYELKSGFYSGIDDSKYGFVPGYGLGNLDFGLKAPSGAWDISGWVRNFTNTHYYLYRGAAGTGAFPTYNIDYAQAGDPIIGGVTLSGRF